jgi:uncharacterized protein YoxC
MSGPKAPQSSEQDGKLAEAVNNLTEHIQVLRESIDEWRELMRWGLQNDKFRGADAEEVHEVVAEALSDATDCIHDAVKEAVNEQTADFKDAVDQFSLDVQHVARKITDKPSEDLNELRETLQGEIVDLRGSVEQFMTEMHDAVTQIHEAVRREKQGTLFDPCVMNLPQGK